jgi:hypothetical protein
MPMPSPLQGFVVPRPPANELWVLLTALRPLDMTVASSATLREIRLVINTLLGGVRAAAIIT